MQILQGRHSSNTHCGHWTHVILWFVANLIPHIVNITKWTLLHCIMYKLHLFNRFHLIEKCCIAKRSEVGNLLQIISQSNIKNSSLTLLKQTLGGTQCPEWLSYYIINCKYELFTKTLLQDHVVQAQKTKCHQCSHIISKLNTCFWCFEICVCAVTIYIFSHIKSHFS